jgi:nicotinamidase-related amidase
MEHSLLVIDMQQASFDRPAPLFDAAGLVERINSLACRVRESSGRVTVTTTSHPQSESSC